MSSTYYVACLAHDPALIVASGNELREWNSPNDALAAVAVREPGSIGAMHATCDLIITRESGAIIEACCPPPGNHAGMHRDPKWVDVEWLRLMVAALETPTPATTAALEAFRQCWNPERVRRMRSLIKPGEYEVDDA